MKKYVFYLLALSAGVGFAFILLNYTNIFKSSDSKIKISYSSELPSIAELKAKIENFSQYKPVSSAFRQQTALNWCIPDADFKTFQSQFKDLDVKQISFYDLNIYLSDNPQSWSKSKFVSFSNTGQNCGDRYLVPLTVIKNKLLWLPNTCAQTYDSDNPTLFSQCDQIHEKLLDIY